MTTSHRPLFLDRRALLGYLLLLGAIPLGFALGGEARALANIGITYVPLLLIATFAYLGTHYTTARVLAILWTLAIFLALTVEVLGFTILAQGGVADPASWEPGVATTLVQTVGMVVVAVMVALLGFIPQVRHLLSRWLPINPASFVHTIAIVALTGLLLIAFVPLLVLGQPPLLSAAVLNLLQESGMSGDRALLSLTVYSLLWSVPVAIFAVGYGIRRHFGAALQRLGLVRPSLAQIGIGIGVSVLLIVLASLLELGIHWLWEMMNWPRTDTAAFGELMAFAYSPLGAILVGISAGLGEELAVRGVLQPRVGILLSNLFFTAVHALQYNWDALLVVFLLGIFFGVLCQRTNTTVSALAHGLYDFLAIMMTLYEIQLFG